MLWNREDGTDKGALSVQVNVYVCEVHQNHPHETQLGAWVYCDLDVKREYRCLLPLRTVCG